MRIPRQLQIRYRLTAIWLPNRSRMWLNTTTEHTEYPTEFPYERQSRSLPSDDHRDLTVTDITAEGLDMEVERITGSLTIPSYWPRRLPNGVPQDKETITEWDSELNAERFHQMTTEKLTDILLKLSTEMAKRGRPRTHWSYHLNDYHQDAVHRDPTEYRIKRWQDLHIQYTKLLFKSRCVLLSRQEWPPSVKAYVLDMDLWYTAHTWCNWHILSPSNGHQRVSLKPTSPKKYSVRADWLRQSGRATSEPSETPRWRITLCPVWIQGVALYIALRSLFHCLFVFCQSPISNNHSGVVANSDNTFEWVHWVRTCIGIAMRWVMLWISLLAFLLPACKMTFSLH